MEHRSGIETVFPPRDPAPADQCGECADLAHQRSAARESRDRSAATDANVLLRRHLAREHP